MTANARLEPPEEMPSGLEIVIVTRVREIVDDFKVPHALPSAKRRMVGPFIFLDQINLMEASGFCFGGNQATFASPFSTVLTTKTAKPLADG